MRVKTHPLTAIIALAVVIGTAAACTPEDEATYDCLNAGRPSVTLSQEEVSKGYPSQETVVANDSVVDMRTTTRDHSSLNQYGFHLGLKVHQKPIGTQRSDLCFIGGTFSTTLDPELTDWNEWHKTYANLQENPRPTIVGARLFNTGDGLTFAYDANDWRAIGIRADGMGTHSGAYIHDDCIENDDMLAGLVDDSKFDGCFSFMSSTGGWGSNGTGHTVTVDHTLVRLQAYQKSFDWANRSEYQHAGFFKWSSIPSHGTPPDLVVRNSTFRVDQPAQFGENANGKLGLPPGTTCDNVMIVGQEHMTAAERASWSDQCSELTWGTVADWDERVAIWDDAHPADAS